MKPSEALKRATDPLDRSWARLSGAKKMIRIQPDYDPERSPKFEERQQLVSDRVARGFAAVARAHERELFCADTTVFNRDLEDGCRFSQLSPCYRVDVSYINVDGRPPAVYQVPGGGQMFRQYTLCSVC